MEWFAQRLSHLIDAQGPEWHSYESSMHCHLGIGEGVENDLHITHEAYYAVAVTMHASGRVQGSIMNVNCWLLHFLAGTCRTLFALSGFRSQGQSI